MTEEQWLTGRDPGEMLPALGERASARKLRLFATECCRRLYRHICYTGISRTRVEAFEGWLDVSDQFADGQATAEALAEAIDNMIRHSAWGYMDWVRSTGEAVGALNTELDFDLTWWNAATAAGDLEADWYNMSGSRMGENTISTDEYRQIERDETAKELAAQAALVREVFGNPFRPVAFDPAWRTDTAVSLARQMYEAREFSAMPILADALQDAGCDNDDVLSHCRAANQIHVRGCWVVDLVLGKE